MTMRLKRSLATLLVFVMYVQPIAQNTFALAAAPPTPLVTVTTSPSMPLDASGAPGTAPGTEPGTLEPGTQPLEPVEPLEPLAPAMLQSGSGSVVFGPNTYVRTTGAPNIYNESFPLPAGISGPFTMHVVNGNANGTNRLSSTTITLNGVEVAGPGDFGQSVAGFDKTVTLQANNQVEYRVTSIPQGFMTVTFFSGNGAADTTPPEIVIVEPSAGQFTNAHAIEVRGGVIEENSPTVVVDGIPATITNTEFVAAAVPVGPGPQQTISVVATDAAGNETTETVTINIDRVAPALAITSPSGNAPLSGSSVIVSGTVTDANTVYVVVNGEPMAVSNGTFTGEVPLTSETTALRAVAHDLAGNETIVERSIVVDSAAPVITILEPQPFAFARTSPVVVRGSVTDASSVVIRAGGAEVEPVNGVFEISLPVNLQGTNLLIVTATDAAGNESMADVTVVFDSVAPVVSFTSPDADALVPSLPVSIQGTFEEQISGATLTVGGNPVDVSGATWSYVLDDLADGPTTVTVDATDGAGNVSSASRSIVIDRNPPVIQIATPASGALTTEGSIAVTGTVQDVSLTEFTVNGVPVTAGPAGAGPRSFAATVNLAEGDNTIVVSAKDALRPAVTAEVIVTRDSTPPTISLTADPKVSQLRPATVNILAADNLVVDRVTVSVNGSLVQTFTAPPYVIDIALPPASKGGDTLAILAEAIDRLGLRAQATTSISVVSDGAVVGQVLTDVDGKPLEGATVSVDGGATIASDAQGRYTFAAPGTQVSLSVSAPNKTTVDRAFAIGRESGTSAVDARLTELATATAVGAAAATLTVGSLTVQVPAAAFADGSSVRVTPLSAQGLPGLLPLGWSPVAALDLRGSTPASALTLRASNAGTQPVYLARYVNRAWHLSSQALAPDAGVVSVDLPIADAISVALVVPDTGDGAPAVPAIGDPLPGAQAAEIPLTATSAGVLDPPVLSPGGGTSIGTLTVTSPTPLPSGTVVQAVMTETFTLVSGDTVSTDARTQDFVLYRAPTGLVATFPVVPFKPFDAASLVQGVVHLDILAGRESVRGSAGGNSSVTLTADGATLTIAQGALTTGDVPMTFQSAVLSSFLPATADVSPLREVSLDFSGRTLEIGAALSVLSSQLTGVGVDDAVVIARVDAIEGVSRLVPVAIGELSGDRYHARAVHGLPGIRQGGRHVWYRVAGGVGFVRGVIDVNGTPRAAIVEVTGLPFASMANSNGQYAAIGRAGATMVRARAPSSSLAGEESADITLNAETTRNISLNGTVSTAAIVPATNAINVSIAAQVEISSPVSITAQSLATAQIQFQRTSEPAGAVPYRVVLSGSGRTLAIVPLTRLAEGATYAVTVAGLADAVAGAIVVPPTTFTTQSTQPPNANLDALVFSFPNEQGEVILNGPPGTLEVGSTILIVNESTGEVSTLGVNNDGSVSDVGGKFVANIADRLIVTITDPQGRTTSFKRSEYVKEDGTTAVGNGGGEILGPGGAEVRIPEDAVMQGVAAILKIAAISIDQLPEGALPDLPGATAATALKLEADEAAGPPAFNKEVDLVFPKPADAPDGATYLVYRRMAGPNGRVAYESIDYATVEGTGADAKVVTASHPFAGYVSSINGYNAQGVDFGGAVGNQFTNYAILMFLYDLVNPGAPLGGVVTGRVLRAKWAPGAVTPTYEPVKGALVSGQDASGQPLFADGPNGGLPPTLAVSQADGTYSLFDRQYTGGAVTVFALSDSVTRSATAYEVDPQNAKSPGLVFAKNVATANITFPALPPAVPPSPVQVEVMTLDANGARKASNGIVIAGGTVVIGVKGGDNLVQRVDVQSGSQTTEYGVKLDPLGKGANGFDVVVDSNQTFATPGSFTITATALNPGGGVVIGNTVVRAVVAGGGNNDPLPNHPPAVLTVRTVPKPNATGVQIGAVPQIAFTEPVQNVPAGVTLTEEGGGTIGVVISGVGPDGPIANLTPQSIVTSITIQPSAGLKYGTKYTLSLSSDIFDTDPEPSAHKPLVAYTTSFTTFVPESIGQTEELFTAGGMAVIGDRAYVATSLNSGRYFTNLRLFDLSDLTSPTEIKGGAPSGSQVFVSPPAFYLGLPVDLVADEESPLTGGPVVAVATTPLAYPYHSSSVRLFDVSNDQQWKWIGAVSLGRDPMDGMIRRIEMKGSMLYAVTAGIGKGIQFVDLNAVQAVFDQVLAAGDQSAAYWQMQGQLLSTEGFAQETIVNTVHVDTGLGANSQLWDLAVTDLTIGGMTQPTVIATGKSPLAIATQTDGLIYNGAITDGLGGPALTGWGYGVAAGAVNGTPIAVVSALGVSPAPGEPAPGHVLAVVDLTNPLAPRKLATLDLPGSATAVQDVLLRDGKVYVGTTSGTFVVAIDDPAHPELVGSMPNVSGRLVLGAGAEEGLLFSAARGILGGETPLGGLRTTALTSEAPRWITRPHYVTDPEMRGQNTSSCAPNCGVGRPVNVVTGNTYFDQTDGVVAGVHGLNFTRSYNSRNAYRGDQSILGRGWTHSFESTITEPEEGALALTGPDGVPLYFRDAAGEGRYEAFVPAGERSVIVKSDIEPRYVRFFMNGSKETFNTAGLLMSREDALGQATSLGRDEQRRLISITDPGGRSLTLRYNDDDRLIELKAGAQVLASYAYDSGNLSEVTYGDASGYRFTYDSQGQVLSVVDHSGRTVEKHTYDAQGRATLSEIENGRERLVLTYDDSRQVTSVADALGNTTQYQWRQVALVKSVTGVVSQCATCDNGISTGKWSYDSAGRVRSQKGASGATTAIVYDPAGNLTSQSEPSGRVTNVTYDERGRPLEIRDSDGSLRTMTHGPAGPLVVTESLSASESRTTSFTYTARGQVSSVTDPRGKTTTFSWSSAGDLESVTSPTQATTTFEYDSLGRRTSTTDPRQRKMTVDYDERGRPTRITAPDQTSTSFGYDLGGRRTTITDQVNRTTSYVYDPYGRLTQVVAPVGTTTYGYDLMANLVEQTEANGQTTQFAYDANRRLSQTTYPGGASERYSYDAAGRLSSRIDRRGVVTTYTYDSAGRLKGKAYSDGSPAVAYSYDAAGYMRSASNGTDSLTWTHDLAGRLLSEQSVKNSSLVEYGYDAADNRISVQLNGGALLGYTYDDASRLTSLSRGPAQFGFTYDPASQRSSLSYPNGIVTNYTLDESSRLLEIAAGTVTRSAYGYDALGNRTSKTTAGYTETYGYDPLGRLTGVDRTGSSSRRFAYDAVGNRTSEELDGAVTTTATYDQLNQLRTRSGASTANYSYDPNGSLDTKVEAGATWRYEWNVEGQLARVTKDGNEVARFTYDPLGRRVEKIAGAVTHSYAYDGMDVLRETVTNGATSTTYRFIHAPGVDQPLAKEDVATGALTYFHADGLGSIVATTDQAGVVTSSITYDAWGNIETGTPAPYAFTGREWDAETGLYYYRARYYDPAIGRFISEDPIGLAAGPNFYAYVSNQPTMLRDPFGLDPWWQNALNSDLGQALVNPWSANVAAGVGDNLSFGATTALNNLIGNGAYIDECSDAFGVGQNIGRVISAGMWVAGPFKAIGGMTMRSAMYNARNFLSSPTAGARQFANSFWRGTSTGAAGRELHHWAVPVAWFKNMPAGARAVFQGGWNQIALSAGTNGWLRPGSLQDWIVRATLAGGLAGIAGGATEGCGCKN